MRYCKSHKFPKEQQDLAVFAKILSHPARIAIIQLLAEKKEIRTGNISDFLPISRTTVTQHLKFLRDNGIIEGTISGLKIHYCLNIDKLREMNKGFRNLFEESISAFICNCDEE
jgi:ArsR family transcriptional regulator, arsenate/arsenite/antimonite-responsive transcriptional repressor